MLLTRATLEAIAAGTVTLAFRRWRRPTVRTGGTLTTAIGVLSIDDVSPVDLGDINGIGCTRLGPRRSEDAARPVVEGRWPDRLPHRAAPPQSRPAHCAPSRGAECRGHGPDRGADGAVGFSQSIGTVDAEGVEVAG